MVAGLRRGEIWWASLPAPLGSAPGYRRPVVIVQADAFNASRIGTVIAVALTTNLSLAQAPGNVVCRRRQTGLAKDSVANVSQVVTVSRQFLTERVTMLPPGLMQTIDAGLRLVLSL